MKHSEVHVTNPVHTSDELARRLVAMRAALRRQIAAHIAADGVHDTAVPSLRLYRQSAATACASAAYEPRLVVFVPGKKRIDLGATIDISAMTSSFLFVEPVDLPVDQPGRRSHSRETPMLGMLLKLETWPRCKNSQPKKNSRHPASLPMRAAWRWAKLRCSCWTPAPGWSILF